MYPRYWHWVILNAARQFSLCKSIYTQRMQVFLSLHIEHREEISNLRRQLNRLKQLKRLSGVTNLSEVTEQIDDVLVRAALSSQVEKDHPAPARAPDPPRWPSESSWPSWPSVSQDERGVHLRGTSLYTRHEGEECVARERSSHSTDRRWHRSGSTTVVKR